MNPQPHWRDRHPGDDSYKPVTPDLGNLPGDRLSSATGEQTGPGSVHASPPEEATRESASGWGWKSWVSALLFGLAGYFIGDVRLALFQDDATRYASAQASAARNELLAARQAAENANKELLEAQEELSTLKRDASERKATLDKLRKELDARVARIEQLENELHQALKRSRQPDQRSPDSENP